MDAHVYKKIEVVGSSPNSSDEAIRNAVAKASQSVRNLRWFEVTDLRGDIADGKIAHFQATVKIGFRLDD
jgi:flavin-binding protein dodecin